MPVVGVNDIRSPVLEEAACDLRGNEGKSGEALPVVRIVHPMLIGVGTARPVEEPRRIEHEKLEPRGSPGKERGGISKETIIALNGLSVVQGFDDGPIARHQRSHTNTMRFQCLWKRTGHIGEPAGFHQGEYLSRHGENVHRSFPEIHVDRYRSSAAPLCTSFNTNPVCKVPSRKRNFYDRFCGNIFSGPDVADDLNTDPL